jgi:sigma-B regulation protein RsbU (phosphoserine phosphatase)
VRILIADDTAFWRMRVGEILAGWGHDVLFSENGEQALTLVTGDEAIDLLITDWEMPLLSGPELCRRLRCRPRASYLPIILLTSRDAKADLAEGLNAGADAFVRKPIDESELRAQIGVTARILELEAHLAAKVRDLTHAKHRLDRDLEAAAAVQHSLLPAEPPDVPACEFAWVYDSCEVVGGDMFNVFSLCENRVGMYVLDVSGHGTSAALLSVGLSHVLTPFPEQGGILKRAVADGSGYEVTPPFEVARELNRRYPLMEKSRQYLTFLYGVLDLSSLEFHYVRAGHPGPIQITRAGARSHDGGGGIPIGITPDARYRDESIGLSPGDGVVFYTDGASEALNEDDEEFGVARLLESLSDSHHRGIAARLGALQKRIAEFGKGRRLRDDVTVVGFALR